MNIYSYLEKYIEYLIYQIHFSETFVSDEELKLLEDKTNRQLRLKELLIEYSKDSSLVVM